MRRKRPFAELHNDRRVRLSVVYALDIGVLSVKREVVLPQGLGRGRSRKPLPVRIDLLQEPVAKRYDLR